MDKKIKSALISVFYKDGLEDIVKKLHQLGVTIYSTGGTQQFIEKLGLPCTPVESLTSYPSILGGRVKTLHPSVFGGILGRRDQPTDLEEMARYHIPEIDLVIVDSLSLSRRRWPSSKDDKDDKSIIEKIDVGGPSDDQGGGQES
jgi:phosphoribosylaminoimidazolecarboxamide formyltransferase/IMP cyclohydrolase